MTRHVVLALAGALALAGCTENTAPGNDREAELGSHLQPAEMESAETALAGVATSLLKPQIMTEADLGILPAAARGCRFRMTRVGFPVFVHPREGTGPGVIKLNGKLLTLQAAGQERYASGGVEATVRPRDGRSADGSLFESELVVRLPGAPHELGFHGFTRCGRPPNDSSSARHFQPS